MEEVVDTTEAPAPGAEPTEPTEPAEPTEPTEPTEPAEPTEPTEPVTPEAYITAEQMQDALQKQDAGFRSWLGRRDKETLSHIGNVINERLATKETPDEMSTRLLENPREVIRNEMRAFETERTEKQTTHLNSAMEIVGGLMESDPLYSDKELGGEVVSEIKQMVATGKIDSDLAPAAAGKLALADAVTSVFRKRAGVKTNPLSGNTPANTSPGVTPPVTPVLKKKMPKLDDLTQKMAEKWNYSQEDLAALYGE